MSGGLIRFKEPRALVPWPSSPLPCFSRTKSQRSGSSTSSSSQPGEQVHAGGVLHRRVPGAFASPTRSG
jgi:hypothetical protein